MKKYHNYTGKDLTIAICAYGECPYLEECIKSLKQQTVSANIVVSTSTPNPYVKKLAKKYDIPVKINPKGGQVKDFNFAMSQGDTPLIMMMHQDEVLRKDFAEKVIDRINHTKRPLLAFTNYIEMHNDIIDTKPSQLVKTKRLLLLPAKSRIMSKTVFGKRIIQSFGNSITHPTVVCVRKELPSEIFREQYKACMDWDLWERMSRQNGEFVYVPEVLLYHRMNDENQSAKLIKHTNYRSDEELEILERFWPKWFAQKVARKYSKAGEKFY